MSPLFDYRCRDCGTAEEKFKRFADADQPEACPKCGAVMERSLINVRTGFKLKGERWGRDGYAGT